MPTPEVAFWINLLFVPVAIAAYLFIALYIYAPLKIKRRQGRPVHAVYEPIDPGQIPNEIAATFHHASDQLASSGFQLLGTVRHQVERTNQDSFVSMWINPKLGDSAQIIGILTPVRAVGLKVNTVTTFRTEFRGGDSIVTSNTRSVSCYPVNPHIDSVLCREIEDVALLYRFHRARIERDRGARTHTLERFKDPASRLLIEHRETHERLISAGYYTLDESGQNYMTTFKGAYLMTYKLLPPFKQIQNARKNRRADRTLRQLGFGGIDAFRSAQSPAWQPGAAPATRP